MIKGLESSLAELKPAENNSNAVDAFKAQVISPTAALGAPAPTTGKPTLGNF